ncbi:multivesicular body subunit 12Bb [Salarias fasciatus]|uniref:multivesicular body subunit 12Bb n=1 Tax=Salarias fasciatus TaxID=181472 RepID=UPI001176BC84|nr:multivesicular body subunit 12B-like [Salarias fasciatus]
MSKVPEQLPENPITAVGIVASISNVPADYYTVAQTTDGCDADLWKDGLFKSKVTRYLCFSRKTGPDVVVGLKLIDMKDALPESFTPLQETMDTNEAATRKRRLCVKMSPRWAAETAVYDIQIIAKTKYQLVNYTCLGEINNMGIWYRMGEVRRPKLTPAIPDTPQSNPQPSAARVRHVSRPEYEQQGSGIYTMTALDDVPFVISERFHEKPKEMQQVNLMGITIKSPAEIEEEVSRGCNARLPLTPLAQNAKQTVLGL